MTLTDFKARLKSGALSGFYIFAGEEDYLKNHYRGELKRQASGDGAFEMFNYSLFDGADMDIAAVREALYAPPMMSDYKVIEWRHADLDKLKESEVKALVELGEAKEDFPYAVFIITALRDGFETTEKKPSRLHARLKEHYEVLIFEKSTDSQLLSWLKKHFDAEGVGVDLATLNAMLFRVGHSMEQFEKEVSKLAYYAKANGKAAVNTEDVYEVCSATVECDAFAISNAIIEKNMEKAFLALTDMKAQRIEPYVVLAQLSKTYGDLLSISLLMDEGKGAEAIAEIMKFHPYRLSLYMRAAKKIGTVRLSDSLGRLVKTDAASKMGGIGGYGAIEMFITQNI